MMNAENIKKVLVIGSGTMGQQVATQCALFVDEVVLYGRNAEKLKDAKKGVRKILDTLIQKGMITKAETEAVEKRIIYSNDYIEASKNIDLVSESVAEEVPVKFSVWEQFAPYLPSHAILTTNTSSLMPSEFVKACGAPDRFLAWHFHTPVFFQNLADIMPLPETTPDVVKVIVDFSNKIHQNSVILNVEHGGVFGK